MNILVAGSLKDVPVYPEVCEQFVRTLGEAIVDHNQILLTGCRGSLDRTIAEAAYNRLQSPARQRTGLISYRLQNADPVHRYEPSVSLLSRIGSSPILSSIRLSRSQKPTSQSLSPALKAPSSQRIGRALRASPFSPSLNSEEQARRYTSGRRVVSQSVIRAT